MLNILKSIKIPQFMRVNYNRVKRRVNGNLRFRMVFIVFIAMLMAGVMSALLTIYIVSQRMGAMIRQGQERVALAVISMSAEDYDENAILDMASFGMYSVRRLEPTAPQILKHIDELDSGRIVLNSLKPLPFVDTLFKAQDNYFVVSIFPNSALLFGIVTAVFFSVALLITSATMLTSMFSKRFLRPIRQLAEATGMVANGDFSVRVKTPHNRELEQLIRGFNRMVADLDVTINMQKDFIDNVSHEIKTPLSSISGFAEMLAGDEITEEQRREYAGIIRSESGRLAALSSNILRMSKLERADEIGGETEFSLSEQLRRVILALEPQWSARDIEFELTLDEVTVTANEELLSQVWINLIDNAIKYSDPGGFVEILLSGGQDASAGVTVEIIDNGRGMDAGELSHAFDKFYQGDRSHGSQGNGLGLALCKRIIELSGGSIEIMSAKDEGTRAVVRI
ncbi:MAG: ATP-binding protein [Oscillospiraceae bacterium]|nr:ATP-binding protein [Oscillospiraceae bacterium]